MVRDDDPDPWQGLDPIAIRVKEQMHMGTDGVLKMLFDADKWDSVISFDAGISVELGGRLELAFAEGVDPARQIGRMFHLFDWTAVDPTGSFEVTSKFPWDLSELYTTGNVTLVPEPISVMGLAVGWVVLGWRRRGK